MEKFIQNLKQKLNENQILENEPMKNHTTFKVGGPVKCFVTPCSTSELIEIIKASREADAPFYVLGRGSNVLFPDRAMDLVVISTLKLEKIALSESSDTMVTAEAGALLKNVSDFARARGLSGFEFASGIPGSVGGAVIMNAGAYDLGISGVFHSARVLDEKCKVKTYSLKDMDFGYRKSAVKNSGFLVLEASFAFEKGDPKQIMAKIDEIMGKRNDAQPVNLPSAGSVFKRPPGRYAGQMIQQCGLKGFAVGGAQVSEKHAGFIVNKGGATAEDIKKVIDHVLKTVYEQFEIMLELEIVIID